MKVPYAIFFLAFIAVCTAKGATVEESAGTIRLFAAGCQKEYARLMRRDDLSGEALETAYRDRLIRATNWALGKLLSGFTPLTAEQFSAFHDQIEAIPTTGSSQEHFRIFLTEVIEGITNLSGDDDGTDSAGSAGSVTVHMGPTASFYDPASGGMQFDVRMPTVDDQRRFSLRSAVHAVIAANRVGAAAASIEG